MFRRLAALIVVLLILAYVVFVPAYSWYLESITPKPMVVAIDDTLSPAQEAYIRIAKLFIFGLFVYIGASVGSFLNVVAECVPLGNSFISRSSACPRCGTRILRRDNLPIIGYLRLKGSCRSCGVHIPIRYLLVELLGAAIFGSLFLFELVSGASNVPGFREYAYKGVVWIVLYTKWDVIALYFFHAMFLSMLMCLALIEVNRERTPLWFCAGLVFTFGVLTMINSDLFPDQIWARFDDSVAQRALWGVAAIPVGYVVGYWLQAWSDATSPKNQSLVNQQFGAIDSGDPISLPKSQPLWRSSSSSNLALAMTLILLVLGWFPALLLLGMSMLLIPLLDYLLKRCHLGHLSSSVAVLFLLAWIHQPFWKTLWEVVSNLGDGIVAMR